MTECYRCGAEDHVARDCPAPGKLPIPPRRSTDPAIARTWADVIRKTLGWKQPDQGDPA